MYTCLTQSLGICYNLFFSSSVSYRCVCEYQGVFPNCGSPVRPVPMPGCKKGSKCFFFCKTDQNCQVHFRDPRLRCYNSKCIPLGCLVDEDCPGEWTTCEKGYCNFCGKKRCSENEMCSVRKRSDVFITYLLIIKTKHLNKQLIS